MNSVISKINQTSNEILKYKFKNDNISANKTNKITNSKHTRHKNYIRICLEPTSNMNNSIEKNQSANTISNLEQSSIHNRLKKIKKNIKLPIDYSNTNYISRNKKKAMISIKDSKDTRKESIKKNMGNYSMTKSINNFNFNIKNNSSLNIILNDIGKLNKNEKHNYIKIVQNNITNKDINKIINSVNLTYEKKNSNKKIIIKKSNNNLNKINDIASKTFEKIQMNKFKINEPRRLNISGKILSNNLKDIYQKETKENNTINNNNRYNPIFKRSRYIKENNFSLNPLSLLSLNKSSNFEQCGYKNKSDMKTINTIQKLKNIIKSNNKIIAKKTSRNYLKSNNKSINISYILNPYYI